LKAKNCCHHSNHFECTDVEVVLIDPLAWKAVGKQRGWRVVGPTKKDNDHNPDSYYNMQEFVAHLHDGKTINEALEAIT